MKAHWNQSFALRGYCLLAALLYATGCAHTSERDQHTAADAAEDLPKVLLIGDSIKGGYFNQTRQLLEGEVQLFQQPGNARDTPHGLKMLDEWLGETDWDIIHFNWGLHDLCYRHPEATVYGNRDKVRGTIAVPLDEYEKNLEKLVKRLKQTGSKLIFATTTKIPEGEAGRFVGDDARYNEVALRIMREHGIAVNDLYAVSKEFGPEMYVAPGDVHHTEKGNAVLAEQVAQAIRAAKNWARRPDRPNIILMMADDLANEDLSCYGSERIQTPRIDQLASEGVKLSTFYAGSAVCTPARMALLSGSYPARLGWRWGVLGFGLTQNTGMSPRVYTIAEAFRDAGYRTAMTGKWHIGSKNMGPHHQGFESAYYIYMSNNQNRDMYRDGQLVQKDWDNRLLTETFTEEVIRVIQEPSDQPFFLYVPWTAPHFPADPHPDWHGNSGEDPSGEYTDVVEELDYRVGQILDALKDAGKADNTIVIFTSDNGRQPGQEGPDEVPLFSGTKWQSLEGGTRVPCIVRYPGVLPAGATSHQLVSMIDLFPTLAEAAEIQFELPADAQKMDGVSNWSNLTQPESEPVRQELLYWHGRGQATAIRSGEWKLHFNHGDVPPRPDPPLSDGPALYNLGADPLENNNLAAEHSDVVERLLARAREKLIEIYNHQIPLGTWPEVELEVEPLQAQDVWGPWMP